MIRLKSELWVAAWLRNCAAAGAYAYLRRRGAADAGAIFLKLDKLNGETAIYGPAYQADYDEDALDRKFRRLHRQDVISSPEAEDILARELKFDPDLWIIEVEDRQGRIFADTAPASA